MNTDASSFLQAFNGYLAQNSPLPDNILASYELCNCLRESNGKAVYIVRSKIDGRPFLLKCAPLSAHDSLQAEYDLLTQLSHPGLPRAFFYLAKDDMAYLIREYVPGPTLAQLVEESGPFSDEQAVHATLSVCDVISYLHAQNPPIIHRDIKPENIIFTNSRGCVLIDLGTARRFRPDSHTDTVFMGTVATAAPEQYGYKQTDARSDIYALGMLLLFLTTGSFQTDDCALIQNRKLAGIVEKCLRFDPKDRFPSISSLRLNLSRAFPDKKRMHQIAWINGAAAGLLLGAVLSVAAGALGLGQAFAAEVSTVPEASPIAPAVTQAPDASKTPVAAQAPAIAFSSPLIEKAVRQTLGFTEAQPLTQGDLNDITQLYVCGETIYSKWEELSVYAHDFRLNGEDVNEAKGNVLSLEDLKHMPNLRQLSLYGQRIMDLTPLTGLQLTRLCLAKNEIMDVTPLKDCAYLTELNLAWNPIEDISPLSGLTHLKKINLSYTQVTDISVLAALPLTSFEACWAPLADYTPLKDMTRLDTLRINNLAKEDAFILKSLTSLTNLTLYQSTIQHFSSFSPLKNLQNLDLYSSQLESVEGAQLLPTLFSLILGRTQVTDLDPLKDCPVLERVDVQNITADLSPLAQIATLKLVSCNSAQKTDLNKILAGKEVTIEAHN